MHRNVEWSNAEEGLGSTARDGAAGDVSIQFSGSADTVHTSPRLETSAVSEQAGTDEASDESA
jgi:hypothetical protein